MTADTPNEQARNRIRAAYDPKLLRHICSIRRRQAWRNTTAACERSSAPSALRLSVCGASGRCLVRSYSATWSR
jgi:hypothetical protein